MPNNLTAGMQKEITRTMRRICALAGMFLCAGLLQAQTIDTVVGNIPLVEIPEARRIPFVVPHGLALDAVTNSLYVSDDGSMADRKSTRLNSSH